MKEDVFRSGRSHRDDTPFISWLVQRLITDFSGKTTLLAVSPNSESVVRAALEVSRGANTPMLFAATLNQVDIEGSYTGWTPASFTRFVREESERLGLSTPARVCLDHGGPWLKDSHTLLSLSLDESTEQVRKSIEACIDADYTLLHIDATIDRSLPEGTPLPVSEVVERTADLIAGAEAYRIANSRPRISYEVGTEEVHGGLADVADFGTFLDGLAEALQMRGISDAWPCFVVGKIGTDLRPTRFDSGIAARLTSMTRAYGSLIKGHYTDYVENLQEYPLSEIGGANVGPALTEEGSLALEELLELERLLGRDSRLEIALKEAIIAGRRWRKWLRPHELSANFDDLDPTRQKWLLRTCSRYVWTHDTVRAARADLYHNVAEYRDADRFVIRRIGTAIMKYIDAFNLVDFNDRLAA